MKGLLFVTYNKRKYCYLKQTMEWTGDIGPDMKGISLEQNTIFLIVHSLQKLLYLRFECIPDVQELSSWGKAYPCVRRYNLGFYLIIFCYKCWLMQNFEGSSFMSVLLHFHGKCKLKGKPRT